MTELRDFIAGVDAEVNDEQRQALSHVKPYDVERANEQTSKAAKDAHGVALKNYFLTHPGEELTDLEWGLVAKMQFGGKTVQYDKPSAIKERNLELYRRLEELGVFQLDKDLVEKAIADGQLSRGDLHGFAHEGEKSQSLQVKQLR